MHVVTVIKIDIENIKAYQFSSLQLQPHLSFANGTDIHLGLTPYQERGHPALCSPFPYTASFVPGEWRTSVWLRGELQMKHQYVVLMLTGREDPNGTTIMLIAPYLTVHFYLFGYLCKAGHVLLELT